MSLYGIGETYHDGFSTYNASNALANADSTPTGVLVVNGADSAATVTITTSSTGRYKVAADLAGRSVGDDCFVRATATVGGLTADWRSRPFRIAFPGPLAAPGVAQGVAFDSGTVSASPTPTTTTFTATGASLNATSNFYTTPAAMYVQFTGGSLAGRSARIGVHGVTGSDHAFTLAAALTAAPAAGDTFIIIGYAG